MKGWKIHLRYGNTQLFGPVHILHLHRGRQRLLHYVEFCQKSYIHMTFCSLALCLLGNSQQSLTKHSGLPSWKPNLPQLTTNSTGIIPNQHTFCLTLCRKYDNSLISGLHLQTLVESYKNFSRVPIEFAHHMK